MIDKLIGFFTRHLDPFLMIVITALLGIGTTL